MSDLDDRLDFLRSLQVALTRAREDLEVSQVGGEVVRAVDFAAVFPYIQRTGDRRFELYLRSEPEERVLARQLVALEILFKNQDQGLVLIPPYAEEIRNFLALIRARVRIAQAETRDSLREKLIELLRNSPEFMAYRRLASTADEMDTENPRISNAAIDVGRRFFPELFAVISFARSGAVTLLRELFDERRLRDWEEVVPEMKRPPPVDSERVEYWVRRIAERRKPRERRRRDSNEVEDRAYQTWIDGRACAFVEEANKRLRRSNRGMVLVTPSGHVRDVLTDVRIEGSGGIFRGVELVRDLNWALVSFTQGGELRKLEEALASIRELSRLYERADALEGDLAYERERVLNVAEPKWKLAENQFLMSHLPFYDTLRSPRLDAKTGLGFLALLHTMVSAIESGRADPAQEAEKLLNEFYGEVRDLEKWLPGNDSLAALTEARVFPTAGQHLVRFPPLSGELPSELVFGDLAVAYLARGAARKDKGTGQPMAANTLRTKIVSIAEAEGAEPEVRLLGAYLIALDGNLPSAAELIEKARATATGAALRELSYLGAVIHRKSYEGELAQELIKVAIDGAPTDSRFWLEQVKVYWVRAVESDRAGDKQRSGSFVESALEALAKTRQLVGEPDDGRWFDIELENAGAFLRCERWLRSEQRDPADIQAAARHVENLERLAEKLGWTSRMHDTRGWVLYARALAIENPQDPIRKELLDSAWAEVNLAHANVLAPARKWLLEQHLLAIARTREVAK